MKIKTTEIFNVLSTNNCKKGKLCMKTSVSFNNAMPTIIYDGGKNYDRIIIELDKRSEKRSYFNMKDGEYKKDSHRKHTAIWKEFKQGFIAIENILGEPDIFSSVCSIYITNTKDRILFNTDVRLDILARYASKDVNITIENKKEFLESLDYNLDLVDLLNKNKEFNRLYKLETRLDKMKDEILDMKENSEASSDFSESLIEAGILDRVYNLGDKLDVMKDEVKDIMKEIL